MWDRKELKLVGKNNFLRNYWPCVVAGLVAFLISYGSAFEVEFNSAFEVYYDQPFATINLIFFEIPLYESMAFLAVLLAVVAFLSGIFVFNMLRLGIIRFFLNNRTGNATYRDIVFAFDSPHYLNMVKTVFLMDLSIFLWSLLLVIPGIIKTYEYFLVPYLLVENPTLTKKEACRLSAEMMYGHKLDVFAFGLSFLGWILLSLLTVDILSIFFVNPYVQSSNVELYTVLKQIYQPPHFEETYTNTQAL